VPGDRLDLIGRHITADGTAAFPALQVVIGAIGSLSHDTEFARLHALDLGDLLEQLRRREFFHGWNIYICIYFVKKKEGNSISIRILSHTHQEGIGWCSVSMKPLHNPLPMNPQKVKVATYCNRASWKKWCFLTTSVFGSWVQCAKTHFRGNLSPLCGERAWSLDISIGELPLGVYFSLEVVDLQSS
jgi:hypothetical protein